MKIALSADWHLRGKDLDAACSCIRQMAEHCARRGVERHFVAGDIFDREAIGDARASVGEIVKAAARAIGSMRYTMIAGNHDYASPATVPATAALSLLPNVTVEHEPRILHSMNGSPLMVVALPWMWTGNAEEALDTFRDALLEFDGPRLLLAHAQAIGARMSKTQTCDHGSWFLTREFLENYPVDRIALGDFHARQELVEGKGGYIGAIRQLNHGESGNPAGFEIWDTVTGEVEWIELQAPTYRTVILRPGDKPERPGVNEIIRYRTEGWKPTLADEAILTGTGSIIEPIIEAVERVTRGGEIPAGALDQPVELLRIWARDTGVAGEDLEELEAELAELVGGAA